MEDNLNASRSAELDLRSKRCDLPWKKRKRRRITWASTLLGGRTVLSKEDNERICRVGPNTPMGNVFRRFWLPVCTSAQLPEADCDPLRVRLVGENLVAFRDSTGAVGLVQENCPHRGASLALGRVEDNGIRCLYHGWKFGRDGTLQDAPNCSMRAIKSTVRARAYPVREEGGLVWAYLGPKEKQPPFTRYAFMDAPEPNRTVIRINVNANYLQLVEGGFDSSHVGILHSNIARPGWMNATFTPNPDKDNPAVLAVEDNDPELELSETDFGFYYAAFRTDRRSGDAQLNVRVVPFIMPSTRIIPAPTTLYTVFETPADDEHTSTFIVIHGKAPVDRAKNIALLGLDDPKVYSERDCMYRATWDDRFGQDRQRLQESWSGLNGIEQEDAAMSLSMGPIIDRSQEHLVPADRAVVALRKMLLRSAKNVEQGGDPVAMPGDVTDVGAPDTFIASSARTTWQELSPGHWKNAESANA
ncbi:Rieske 2Fe-2S domain-containing protein [Peristeroidobacter soli]|uniref:Rieske 2Fe-2S domain-containing protein n=1 Tax=Peristeroidobacter soli TaxID=2497877 RepID=UPI001C37C279|nr:Rieske 2Fe-2S domain-containing protein [Peristeroidobacter soli]